LTLLCNSNLQPGSLLGTLGVLLLAGVCFASAPEAAVAVTVRAAEPKLAGSTEVRAQFDSLPDAPLPNPAVMPGAAGSGSGDEVEVDLAVESPASAAIAIHADGAVTRVAPVEREMTREQLTEGNTRGTF
jgi:hypothetical protein